MDGETVGESANTENEQPQLNYAQILLAHQRIRPHVHCTPVLTSATLNALANGGKQLFFKCECFQKTGSFKSRGALNAVLCALERDPTLPGVITHSSGNHGQALAWAARQNSLNCAVVVPKGTPAVKLEAIKGYGAQLHSCEPTMAARWATCERISKELGYKLIDPHNDVDVMAGQGTIALELLEQVPNLDAVIVSVGGGGMVAGVATAVKAINNRVKVFCTELNGKGIQQQLETNVRQCSEGMFNSIADGIRVIQIGSKCFGPMLANVEMEVFPVSEEEIRAATLLLWQRLKVVAEPSAALPLAAVLREADGTALRDCQRIGLVICGGNVNIGQQNSTF